MSQYPSLEGRFLQVSGIKFCFDSSKPKFQRVDIEKIKINGENLDLKKVDCNFSNTYRSKKYLIHSF